MGCPSCGAEISYDERFAVLTVCEYCNSAVIFDEKAAAIAGKMSVLAKPAGPLFVGAAGSIKNELNFLVIGRVRYGYENGYWDEWYLQHEDMSTSWLTEDEKRFMHEQPVKLEIDKDAIIAITPGQNIELNDIKFSVKENGTAICEGGQGQLPFRIISGENLPFLDLTGSMGQTATIEIEPEGTVKFFQGNPLEYNDIQVDSESTNPNDDLGIEKAATATGRERVTYDSSRMKAIQCIHCGGTNDEVDFNAADIKCSHCSMSLEMPAEAFQCPDCSAQVQSFTPGAKSICCQYCGSSVSVAEGKPTLLRKLKVDEQKRKKTFKLTFPLGSKATFDKLLFTVVGYVRFKEIDGGVFISDEYLLYNKEWGYRWLVCYEGHYTIEQKLAKTPQIEPHKLSRFNYKQTFSANGKKWKFYETGKGWIDWVDGELPWVAKIKDKLTYFEAIAPPEMLVCEVSSREAEWSLYSYLTIKEVAQAFNKEPHHFRKPVGIASCQVNKNAGYQYSSALIALAFAFLAIILFFTTGSSATKVTSFKLTSAQYQSEYLSPEFDLKVNDGIYRADFYSPVDNAWVYLDLALVNEKEQAELDFSAQISYYHGYDDGSWSEGSQDDSIYFKAKKGKYRFLILGSAGQGASAANVNQGKNVTITVYQDVRVVHYFLYFAAIAVLIFIFNLCRPLFFEGRRWKHAVADDDD